MARGSNNIGLAKEKIIGILAVVIWIFIFLSWLRKPSLSPVHIIMGIGMGIGIIAICFPKFFKWFETDRPDVDIYKKSRKKNRRKK